MPRVDRLCTVQCTAAYAVVCLVNSSGSALDLGTVVRGAWRRDCQLETPDCDTAVDYYRLHKPKGIGRRESICMSCGFRRLIPGSP